MEAGTAVKSGLRIVAACFVFGVCLGIGGALAGVAKVAPKEAQAQATPAALFLPLAALCLSVGSVVSYLVLRSSWRGLRLVGVLFAATYGISTIATQVESLFFLSAKMPRGMIGALFVQGAIAMALFATLAVLILGKWRRATPAGNADVPPLTAVAITWRIALLVVAFIFLYMLFGYYIAWRNPALRAYYGGTDVASFCEAMKSTWQKEPLLFLLQVFRALLYVACVYPLLSMLRVARWEKAVATAAFLASWTTVLLLPNPLMPATVARSHLWETLAFNLTFGALLGWLLGNSGASVSRA